MLNQNPSFTKKMFYWLSTVVVLAFVIETCLQIGVRAKLIPYYSPLENAYYSYNVVPYFSKPCCVRDSISGFRWLANGARAIKICRGQIIFDQTIRPNNAGYISPSPFEPHKKDSTVFRWLVFGDSFTDGYFLSQNWPSKIDSQFKLKNRPIEIHSFALNGSGIKTWARILDRLNKMNYEYDGVIIACFGNDLSREDFIMEHTNQYCYFGWQDLNLTFDSSRLQKEPTILDNKSVQNAAEIIGGKYANSNWHLLLPYYLHILSKEVSLSFMLNSQSKALLNTYIYSNENSKKTDSLSMCFKYGESKMSIIDHMLMGCYKNNKRIILASIPEKVGLSANKDQDGLQLNVELKWLAMKYKTSFFDGYSIGDKTNDNRLFLDFDGHWNQNGSDIFANRMSDTIINQSKRVQ